MQPSTNIIFGATGGIGSHTARQLYQNGGVRLVLAARSRDALERLREELLRTKSAPTLTGHSADTEPAVIECDATDSAAVERVFQYACDQFSRVDGVAHCVGSILLRPAHATSDAALEDTLTRNTKSAFYVLRSACGRMMKNDAEDARANTGGGSIVLCSSAVARHGIPNHEAIAGAKAALEGMARSAAATYAPYNVRVNCVAPGMIDTKMAEVVSAKPAARQVSEAMHALGRMGQPEEAARAVSWLLQQTYVTGQVLGVDGGLSRVRSQARRGVGGH